MTQAQAAKNHLVDIQISRVASVDKGANRRTFAVIKRSQEPPDPAPPTNPPPVDPPSSREGDPVTKTATPQKPSLEGMNADQKAYLESLEKNQKPDTPAEPVDLSKAEDYVAEIRKMSIPVETQDYLIKAEKRNRDNEQLAKSERDARRRSEHVAKAQTDYGVINKSAENLGDLMMRLEDQCDAKTYGEVAGVLKSAGAIAKSAEIFKELGGEGESTSGSASEEINKRAVELRKADPKLSVAQARTQAADADPELKKRWQKEQRGE